MKIDPQIVTIVEHLLIRDVDDGTVYINQRCQKAKTKPSEKKSDDNTNEEIK